MIVDLVNCQDNSLWCTDALPQPTTSPFGKCLRQCRVHLPKHTRKERRALRQILHSWKYAHQKKCLGIREKARKDAFLCIRNMPLMDQFSSSNPGSTLFRRYLPSYSHPFPAQSTLRKWEEHISAYFYAVDSSCPTHQPPDSTLQQEQGHSLLVLRAF
jgi:hypothetical protein